MVILHDIFIGTHTVSQGFGKNPSSYSWIKDSRGISILGHNGIDWGYGGKNGIQLLNPFPKTSKVVVTRVGFDKAGYGWFTRLWDKTQNCVVLMAHCQEILVRVGQVLTFQQLVAFGDNTGWSTGPHLHLGFYMVDDAGNKKNRANGFDGYLDALNPSFVEWKILNPKAPATPDLKTDDALSKCIAQVKSEIINKEETYQEMVEWRKKYEQSVKEIATSKKERDNALESNKVLFETNIELTASNKYLRAEVKAGFDGSKKVQQAVSEAVKIEQEKCEAKVNKYDYRKVSKTILVEQFIKKLFGGGDVVDERTREKVSQS